MTVDLYHLANLKAFLEEHGLEAKHSLGQNFLFHERECQKIIQAADIKPKDKVLEIGPGLGHLTHLIEETGAEVTAYEIDQRLTSLWPELYPDTKTEIRNQDFLQADPKDYSSCTKVVANLPYYIVKEIITKLISTNIPFRSLTFTLQKEEALRLAQKPGDPRYGALNAMLQILGPVQTPATIKKDNFYPRPHVDSAILKIGPITWPEINIWSNTQQIIKTAFSQRRKQLQTSLKPLNISQEAFAQANISPTARPESLDPRSFLLLAQSF
ncbi:ribosomal RNA small subunit methyltransferase A [bacterium]|nr:ribosomal RNA small subunit methyltransferase A [bacterium]